MLIDSKSSLQIHFTEIFNFCDLYIDKKYYHFYIFLKINLIIYINWLISETYQIIEGITEFVKKNDKYY